MKEETRETRPEKYLREIRDLQQQNFELLKKLNEAEEEKISSRRWNTIFRVTILVFPYVFSAYISWVFYEKVQDTFESLKTFIVESPSRATENVKEGVVNGYENITETGAEIWKNNIKTYIQD